jgi:hypothetical protein
MIEADPSDPSSLVFSQQTGFIRFYRVSCGLTDLPGVFKMKHLSHGMPCALVVFYSTNYWDDTQHQE